MLAGRRRTRQVSDTEFPVLDPRSQAAKAGDFEDRTRHALQSGVGDRVAAIWKLEWPNLPSLLSDGFAPVATNEDRALGGDLDLRLARQAVGERNIVTDQIGPGWLVDPAIDPCEAERRLDQRRRIRPR